ncbi:MAG: SsrA-binding protein SmpB [Desulfobacteraceae bacterium]|nr:SsrA-binding protein SmpB [Desulfobacteraceae bacterium]MBC2755985.1 SsrA-binding protein SmpB [Desulfobacteraceae bacterium]
MENSHIKIVTKNRKAWHNYSITEEIEAGMVLLGTEVKSLRSGGANLKDAYGRIEKGELILHQVHISPYPFAYYDNHDPLRPRKLLLHKSELKRMEAKIREKGFSVIPLKIYFKNGKAKVTIGLARGKRKYDKRESIKEREMKREMDRAKRKDY